MRKILLTIAFILLTVMGAEAQNFVHIVQKDSTTSVNLDEVVSLEFITIEWMPIGKALYTDDVVSSPGFGLQCLTYEVEVEQNIENPKIIRLKNAYGAIYPYNAPGDYDTKKDYYITFNCEDPEGVYIDGWCEMGMDWGYGMFSVTSYGYYLMAKGYSFEEAKAAGVMGTLDENLCITFPVNDLVMQMADWGMTYANKNGGFKLDLSTTTFAEKAKKRASQQNSRMETRKDGEMTFKVAENTFIAE